LNRKFLRKILFFWVIKGFGSWFNHETSVNLLHQNCLLGFESSIPEMISLQSANKKCLKPISETQQVGIDCDDIQRISSTKCNRHI
jgi:hypothetical protein